MNLTGMTPVPGIRWAMLDNDGRPVLDDRLGASDCCNTCQNCRKSGRHVFLGWCMKYPSEQPNVGLFQVCSDHIRGQRLPKEITEPMGAVKRHPERYSPGDFKRLVIGGKELTMVLEEVYPDGRTIWKLHDEAMEGGDEDVGT